MCSAASPPPMSLVDKVRQMSADELDCTRNMISLMKKVIRNQSSREQREKEREQLRIELDYLLNGIEPPKPPNPFDFSQLYISPDAAKDLKCYPLK